MKQLKIAFLMLILFSILTGLIYPAVVTGIAQLFFPWQANGCLIEKHGRIIGSVLIGQSFTDDHYFWGRPSATTPFPYNAANSAGSNLGPLNPLLYKNVKERMTTLQKSMQQNKDLIPADLVTSSGSGLDPEISPLAALYQVGRVAKARGLSEERVKALVYQSIQKRQFRILGEPRVNVLQLNLALDDLAKV